MHISVREMQARIQVFGSMVDKNQVQDSQNTEQNLCFLCYLFLYNLYTLRRETTLSFTASLNKKENIVWID